MSARQVRTTDPGIQGKSSVFLTDKRSRRSTAEWNWRDALYGGAGTVMLHRQWTTMRGRAPAIDRAFFDYRPGQATRCQGRWQAAVHGDATDTSWWLCTAGSGGLMWRRVALKIHKKSGGEKRGQVHRPRSKYTLQEDKCNDNRV